MRSVSGKVVVVGALFLAVGGTVLLNLTTKGPPRLLEGIFRPSPRPTATVVVTPTSPSARPGSAYRIRLISPCGTLRAVDFDGSFWRPADGRAWGLVMRRLVSPVDPGTITLQAPASALLRTASGQALALRRASARSLRVAVCS